MMEISGIWVWIAFNLFVMGMLAIDLGVFHRNTHSVSVKEASGWTIVWVSLALAFAVGVYFLRGAEKSLEFLAGYLIEYSLSVDNIFVFVLLFTYFKVSASYQHRVLFWGILGALIMRGTLIGVGAALIERFHWIIYIFGAFLVFTGIRMGLHKDDENEIHPDGNLLVRIFRRFMPITRGDHGPKFFVREGGRLTATPLFVVLLIVESTDLVFAVDSIPAIFAVTTDPFIVYTSNVFAILGLRSLYFLLSGVIDKFYYLKLGLAVVLTFVGVKMLVTYFHIEIPILVSLAVIASVLILSVIASLIRSRHQPPLALPKIEPPAGADDPLMMEPMEASAQLKAEPSHADPRKMDPSARQPR